MLTPYYTEIRRTFGMGMIESMSHSDTVSLGSMVYRWLDLYLCLM